MTDAYGLLFREVLQPAWERGIRHRPILEQLDSLERSQWFSLDELRLLQERALRKLIEHACQHVPHYRKIFEARGLRPEHVRSLDDLRKLPLLTRAEIAENPDAFRSSVEPFPEIEKTTSGTTGAPLTIRYDRGSEYFRQAVKLRGYGWAHYRLGDRSLHFWGNTAVFHRQPLAKKAKVALDHALKRELFIDCTDRSPAALERVVNALNEHRPAVLLCYAQAGTALARHVVESGARVPRGLSVITAAERLFPADRELIERAFGDRVFETYGGREFMLIASECDAHAGLHVSMENLIVEVVVRQDGRERPAEPGELGEVVVTDLHNFGSPFIRYLIGDLATYAAPGRCGCGRALSRLQSIEGRTTETLRDAAGNPVSGLLFSVIFTVLTEKVRAFQAVQKKDGSIALSIVPSKKYDDDVPRVLESACARYLPGILLEIRIVPEIAPGPSGKLAVVKVEH